MLMQINGWLGSSSNDSLRSEGKSADQPDYNWSLFLNKSICLTQFCSTCGTVGRDILLNQSYPSPFHSKLPLLPVDTFVVKVKGGGWSLYWWKIEQCDHLSPVVVGADGPEEVGQESRRAPPTTEGVYSVGTVQQAAACNREANWAAVGLRCWN